LVPKNNDVPAFRICKKKYVLEFKSYAYIICHIDLMHADFFLNERAQDSAYFIDIGEKGVHIQAG
jgi:hypothetical protein